MAEAGPRRASSGNSSHRRRRRRSGSSDSSSSLRGGSQRGGRHRLHDHAESGCVIVVDNGSGSIRAGFAGYDAPTSVFPSLVGRPRHAAVAQQLHRAAYVGYAAQERRHLLTLKYPIEHGIVTNWDDLELIWQYMCARELKVAPDEHGVLLTEQINGKANRERMTQISFEKMNVQHVYIAMPLVLSLYSTGRTTGLVIDSGEGVTRIASVLEGFPLPHATMRLDLAGRDLDTYLLQLLTQQRLDVTLTSAQQRAVIKDVKEQVCYAALDPDVEDLACSKNAAAAAVQYELPDGNVICIDGDTRWRTVEAMFAPSRLGLQCAGLAESAHTSVMKCDVDTRRELYDDAVVLTGGNTAFPGMAQRVRRDMASLAPSTAIVDVVSCDNPATRAWLGGSILASLCAFHPMMISRQEYDETGPSIVFRKCF